MRQLVFREARGSAPTRLKSSVATSASSDVTGSTGSAVPRRASKAAMASASMSRDAGRQSTTNSERAEDLDLGGAAGHMVLAADHVGDGEGDVVDHRGEAVELAAVGAHQHGIALARLVDVLGSAHQIVPAHFLGGELEAPMRPTAFSLQTGAVGIAKLEGSAVINRRAALREQACA
jgi:hypothetical protein